MGESEPIIRVEGLGKKYVISHRQEGRGRYQSLRDALMNGLRAAGRRLVRPFARTERPEREEFWALKDVSFEVKRGEVVGIIGRNGAGKSTLLKVLSRITEPTTGRVTLHGRVASLLEVGTGFHPELTGRENVYLNGAILGMSRAEIKKKFDEIVAFAEVEKFLDTPVKRFSSGMYMRLAFAVAAHLEPEILVVDEVLAVGDAAFQEKCLGKMDEASRKEGRSVLFVSHNMSTVQQLCGRVVLLRGGRLAEEGEPAKVVRLYLADTHAAGKVSLRDWKDRVSNGDAQIVDFELFDETGRHTDVLPMGGTFHCAMTVDFNRPVAQPMFGVLIHSAAGEPMLDLRSNHGGLRAARAEGRVVVETVVENLGLYPGEYTLSPWVWDSAGRSDVDWAKHCCTMSVVPAPGRHGDLKLDPAFGKYFTPSAWTVRQLPRGAQPNLLPNHLLPNPILP